MTQLMQAPTPGMSLTNDPENPKPFEGQPEFTKVEEAQEHLFDMLVDEDKIPAILEAMRQGVPLSTMAQAILFGGFAKGKWNPDVYLMLIEPCIYILMFIAEQSGVNFVLYPDQNMDIGTVGEHQFLANSGRLASMLGIDASKIDEKLPEEIINKIGDKVFDEEQEEAPTNLLGDMG